MKRDNMNQITAVIPAAGLGTRALPNSFANPKELAAVYNKPAIQWVVEEAIASNVEKVVIVVSYDKAAIKRFFAGSIALENDLQQAKKHQAAESLRHIRQLGERIVFVEQTEPLGLGHAVLCAESECDDAFVVMTPDDLWLPKSQVMQRITDRFLQFNGEKGVVATRKVPIEQIQSYGCPKPVQHARSNEDYFDVECIVEKPSVAEAPSDLGVSGRWMLPHVAFEFLRAAKPGAQGEIQLTTALDELASRGNLGTEVFADGLYCDTGNPLGLTCASMLFAAQDAANRSDLQGIAEQAFKEFFSPIE